MRWICTLDIFANLYKHGVAHFDGLFRQIAFSKRSVKYPILCTMGTGQALTGSWYPTRPELIFKYPTRPVPKIENDRVPDN